jgi:hypothetical protein
MLSFGESSSYKSFRGVIKTGDKVGGEVTGVSPQSQVDDERGWWGGLSERHQEQRS